MMHYRALRVKTGCKTCKRRRKKCDEQKPVCSTCARLYLECRWETESRSDSAEKYAKIRLEVDRFDQQRQHQLHKYVATSPQFLGSSVIYPSPSQPQLSECDKIYHPLNLISRFLAAFVTPMARKAHNNPDTWLSIVLHNSCTKEAAMAWGASWLLPDGSAMSLVSNSLCSSALVGLRRYLQRTERTVPLDAVISAYFLGLFEANWSDDLSAPLFHWAMVAYGLDQYLQKSKVTNSIQAMFRILAETIVYNITNNVLFVTDLDSNIRVLEMAEKSLVKLNETDEPVYITSPLLGNLDVFCFSTTVFKLCRQFCDSEKFQLDVQQCLDQQILMFESADGAVGVEQPMEVQQIYVSRIKIQLSALGILLRWVRNPKRPPNPMTTEMVDNFRNWFQIQYRYRAMYLSDGLCWSICILLCAATTTDGFNTAARLARTFLPTMCVSLRRRLSTFVESIRTRRTRRLYLRKDTMYVNSLDVVSNLDCFLSVSGTL